jgi:hypothetical protein
MKGIIKQGETSYKKGDTMKSLKGIGACACALLFVTMLFAAEKPVAQVAAAPVAKAATEKAKAAPEAKKDEKSMEACQKMGCSYAKEMIAPSSDGGVFVLVGKRLLKYDAKLNLQKEVEIKTDKTAAPAKKAVDSKAQKGKPPAEKKALPKK